MRGRKAGYRHSAETRAKISRSMMGHYVSEQTKDRISAAMTLNSPVFQLWAKVMTELKEDPTLIERAKMDAEKVIARMKERDLTNLLKSCTF
jgi:uncharacterized protein (UPF0276 family)